MLLRSQFLFIIGLNKLFLRLNSGKKLMVSNTLSTKRIRLANLLLLGLVLVLFFLNFYQSTLFFRPTSYHQWRQSDCLSITKNYYEEGMNFLTPKIHYQGVKDGKAVSEMPILNYSVAALWKVFGEHEFIYRLLEYFIFLTAVFILFNTILRFYRSELLAFFTAIILLTSPLLVYYSLNFIADVPAFSLGLICLCLFFNFYHSGKTRSFYLALLIGTLAVLIKASALMGLGFLLFFSLTDLFGLNRFLGTNKLFSKKSGPLVAIVLSIAIIIAWYRYAIYYNGNDPNNIFLLTTLPIWELQTVEIFEKTKALFNNLFPVFLNKAMFFLCFVLVLFVITKFKQLSVFLKYAFVFSSVFFVAYILFFFQVFKEHDYYLTNLLIFPVVTLFCFCHLVMAGDYIPNNIRFLRAFVIVTFIFNAFHAAGFYRLRTIKDDKMSVWYPWISEEDINLADYLFWDYGNSIEKLETFRTELRKHGINRNDHVLSIPDQSFDISLYFMDQKGYTISRDHLMHDTSIVERFLKKKIKYVVLSDTTLKQQLSFKRAEHLLQSFFIENGVEVFKRKEKNPN
jgi:hypothetical protein